jgi:hypothetical protein
MSGNFMLRSMIARHFGFGCVYGMGRRNQRPNVARVSLKSARRASEVERENLARIRRWQDRGVGAW